LRSRRVRKVHQHWFIHAFLLELSRKQHWDNFFKNRL